jgi:acyl transferase domain-containing protein/acyl carrier protein
MDQTQESHGTSAEPVAIVGIGCHLPGNISSVEGLLAALREGRDCVAEVPPDRWDVNAYYDPDTLTPGKTYVRHGGFVHDIDRFDAGFFGIADAEASRMDPQQRMVLQTVWHAVENAGQSAEELMRSRTGVFLAMMNTNGYSQLKGAIEGSDGVTGYDAVGDAMSITAGRISHFLGLEGPCLALDTACSGSMVAAHLACRSILLGECDAAIVVGVNAMLHPGVHIAFSKLGLMSRKGQCAAFDEAADGYIRGEGCVAVLLRRQSLAVSRADHVFASIVASAINQDGRTPAITAPNGASQEKVIRLALRRMGGSPDDIGYVEAHGTGTPVGDPIEMQGLVKVYGSGRSTPLLVGSVKSNFGHLEAAAGLLGIVKAALSLDAGLIFPSLHFHRLNPNIDLGQAPIRVARQVSAWPRGERRRMAGVNSFGYSGTNAHAILCEAELRDAGNAPPVRPCEVVVLSAKSAESLRQLADAWTDYLTQDAAPPLPDIAYTAALGRTHLRHRLAIVGSSNVDVAEKLRSWRDGRPAGGFTAGQASSRRKLKTAFVFTGQGALYAKMGRQLDETEPQFRSAIDRVASRMDSVLGLPLREVLFGEASDELVNDQRYAVPALFAIQYALTRLLSHWGIEPDYVIGHDAGEIAAACVAGVLDLDAVVQFMVGQAASIRALPATTLVVSSVTGEVLSDADLSEHWSLPRQPPALFRKGIGTIIQAGCTVLIEVGPHPMLSADLAAAVDWSKTRLVPTLERDGQAVPSLLATLGALYALGAPARLDRQFAAPSYRRVSLPLYPFRPDRHWVYGELKSEGTVELHPVLRSPANDGSQRAAYAEAFTPAEAELDDPIPETPSLYEIEWQPKELVQRGSLDGNGRWLILADRDGVGRAVAEQLEALGETCIVAPPAELSQEDFRQLFKEHFREIPPRGVIHLWTLDAAWPATDLAQELGCGSALHLVQAMVKMEWGAPPRLWLVTRNAQAVGESLTAINPAQAPLWGLGKVIAIEHPELRCTKVDLSAADSAQLQAFVQELAADDLEDQIAWRNDVRHVARLVRREERAAKETVSFDQPFRLEIPKPGILDHLARRAVSSQAPGPGQVGIQVSSAGLNFNDVLKAMGMYPGLPDGAVPLGSECSGTVVAVGPDVEGLAVGDAVVTLAPFSFSSLVIAAAPLVWRKPAHLSFDEAATIPVAFLTAHYALRHLGQLTEGDRVLIHAASGGVGLAAVQIAQHAGAEIFATAGRPEKRAFLKTLGIRHVMDSRSLAFADETMAATGGRGVDVVLNSLSGGAMLRSLDVLAPFGRFLEIGKRDIYENRDVGLAPFQKQLAYFSIDLERLFSERPALGVKLFREVMQGFENGTFKPLRHRVFPISDAVDAFREMAQAKHIGKIAVSFERRELPAPVPAPEQTFRDDRTYLITGGLGGLGLAVAQGMVARGARHLVLLGRSAPSEAARTTLAELAQTGATVEAMQTDVAEPAQVAKALAEIDRRMPALAGILHAAGIQDDGILLHLSRERFRNVMAPKVAGAWNLHTLTTDRKLDFFVLFSSVASLIGSPGQGNYAAANAFLDSLALYRRANGLPALSINWGAWSQVGLAARMDRDDRMNDFGMMSITPQQGVEILERLLGQRAAQVGVMRVQMRRWQQLFPRVADWPFLERIALDEVGPPGSRAQASALRSALMALPTGQQRRALIESRLQEELARVLRVNPPQVGLNEPLQSFGLDSISAVELRNRWAEEFGLVLAPTLIWDYPTISALAEHLALMLVTASQRAAPVEAVEPAEDAARAAVIAQIKTLSEGEAEHLLLQRLSNIETKRPQ